LAPLQLKHQKTSDPTKPAQPYPSLFKALSPLYTPTRHTANKTTKNQTNKSRCPYMPFHLFPIHSKFSSHTLALKDLTPRYESTGRNLDRSRQAPDLED